MDLVGASLTTSEVRSSLATTLVTSIIGIGIGIGDYLKEMINQDNQAAETLQRSRESNVYGK